MQHAAHGCLRNSLSFFLLLSNNTRIATNTARNDKLKLARQDNCRRRNYAETAIKEQRGKKQNKQRFAAFCCCLFLCTAFYCRVTAFLFNALLKLHRPAVLADIFLRDKSTRAGLDSGRCQITQVLRSTGRKAHTQTTSRTREHRFHCIKATASTMARESLLKHLELPRRFHRLSFYHTASLLAYKL